MPYWPAYSSSKPYTLLIDNQLTVANSYRDAETQFWIHYLPSVTGSSNPASMILQPSDGLIGEARGDKENHNVHYSTSLSRLRTLAWSMTTLSIVLLLFIIILVGLLIHQRRKQTFSADVTRRSRQTSAKSLARALASSSRNPSLQSSSGLY